MTPTSNRYIRCPDCGLMRPALAEKCDNCGSRRIIGRLDNALWRLALRESGFDLPPADPDERCRP